MVGFIHKNNFPTKADYQRVKLTRKWNKNVSYIKITNYVIQLTKLMREHRENLKNTVLISFLCYTQYSKLFI